MDTPEEIEKTPEQLEREAAGEAIREFVARDPSLISILQTKFGVIDIGLDNIQARADVVDIAEHLAEVFAETEAAVAEIEQEAAADDDDDDGDAGDDDQSAGDTPQLDLKTLDAAQLRSFAEQNGIEVPAHPATGVEKLMAAIETELAKRQEAANAG